MADWNKDINLSSKYQNQKINDENFKLKQQNLSDKNQINET